MPNFHSSLSRRDFMKGLGVAGAGLGTAAATAPVFQDLDDVISSPNAEWKRPWWVKYRELDDPTTEIDWSLMNRWDARQTAQAPGISAKYLGVDEVNKRYANVLTNKVNAITNNTPGQTLKDYALSSGSGYFMNLPYMTTFMGPQKVATPQSINVPVWQGTPEENSRMLRSAVIFYGGGQVGFGVIDQKIKDKLVFTNHKGAANSIGFIENFPPPLALGKSYVFEEVDVGYEGDTKFVLPSNKQLYEFCFTVPMSKDMFRTANESQIMYSANLSRYRLFGNIQNCIQEFIRSLGYTCYGYASPFSGMMPAIASAQLTGLTEGNRNNGFCTSPEYGPIIGVFSLVTDMPLEPTNPIDAGIWRFCQTCTKCADACPVNAIPKDHEPTWDLPNIYGKADIVHSPGRKQYWTNAVDCWLFLTEYNGCGACMATCTFNTNSAPIHEIVRATLSTTPALNSFLWQADKFFGYGLHEDKEAWWDLSLPVYGFDSAATSSHGGYNK